MKLTLIAFLAFFPLLALPQQEDSKPASKTNSPASVTKVVRIRYANTQEIANLIIHVSPVNVSADNVLKVILLHGAPDNVASVEQTIRELDVPNAEAIPRKPNTSKDIELIVSVIGGSDKAELLPEGQIPESMTPVVKQLRATFPYKSYQLLSSMLLRSSAGAKAESRGDLAGFGNQSPSGEYSVQYGEGSVSIEDSRPAIHLRNFNFQTNVAVPIARLSNTTQFKGIVVNIGTDIDLREGQKIVVGKANVGSSDLALFVVLTARLVD